jgi:ribosomal protein S18 acetylase RimI-like enzyme
MVVISRLSTGAAGALAEFYDALSAPSKRTFRPLGESTTVEACREIANAQIGGDAGDADKIDLVASAGAEIVGWSFVWSVSGPEPTFGLGVADAYQGQGLGGRLMDRVLDLAHECGIAQIHLTVVQDNLVALGMYERRGFVRCGAFTGEDGLPYYRLVSSSSTS